MSLHTEGCQLNKQVGDKPAFHFVPAGGFMVWYVEPILIQLPIHRIDIDIGIVKL